MTEELLCGRDEFHLLKQFEHILERDTLIDEVGFIHPSQFATLVEDTVGSCKSPVNCVVQAADGAISPHLLDVSSLQHDGTIFWNRDHKLAISIQALFSLYNAAKHAFMTALKQYKQLIDIPEEREKKLMVEKVTDSVSVSGDYIETEVLRHSKALLLLSSDYGTAWNCRKIVASRKQQLSLLMDDLLLSALVLSYSPKSEHAWNHRRWVIKTINGKYPIIQDIVERESELVEKIAEKSKMNYRAWSHRCWLIAYMTCAQVLNELNKTRKWAELHVADNSCFHYRQHLICRMLEDSCSKHCSTLTPRCIPNVYYVWMEELDWNEMLIKRYIGREALWLHRRFLSQLGIKYFCTNTMDVGGQDDVMLGMDNFINSELQLLQACLNISDNIFEDSLAQGVFAASYILWVSKHLPGSQVIGFREKLRVFGELKTILSKLCPAKTLLWDDLID